MIAIIIIFPNKIQIYFCTCFKNLIMIQRIQTLYLLSVLILSIVNNFIPVSSKVGITDGSVAYRLDMLNIVKIENGQTTILESVFFNMAVNGSIGLLALLVIFLYKKRSLQLKVCKLIMLLSLCLIGLLFYETDRLVPGSSDSFKIIYLPAIYVSVVIPVFIFLAQKAIKRDDELVRSVDRIR